MSLPEFEPNELVSFDVIAETLGTSRLRVERLVRLGLLDVVDSETGERLVPRLTSAPEVMQGTLAFLRTQYGSIVGYLAQTGLLAQEMAAVARRLRQDNHGTVHS